MRTLPLETAGGFSRPLRVMAGEGMVEPTEPLVLKENGKTEQLLPGRYRLARDYPAVLKNPEWFKPCDPKDVDTYRHHRRLLVRRAAQLGGTTRTTAAPKRFQLNEGRRERFKLQ